MNCLGCEIHDSPVHCNKVIIFILINVIWLRTRVFLIKIIYAPIYNIPRPKCNTGVCVCVYLGPKVTF